MKTYKDLLLEKSNSNIMNLATKANKTEELRELLNKKHKITSDIPYITTTSPAGFAKKYNQLLAKYRSDFKVLFNDVPKGVGPGEVLLSYLSKKLTIGGGSATYDVNLGSNQIEVKACNISRESYAYNFKLGIKSTVALQAAIKEIRTLYSIAKYFIPEIDNSETIKKVEKGEMTSLRKYLTSFDTNIAKGLEKVDVTISKNLDIKYKDIPIGTLSDKDIVKDLKAIAKFGATKLKSWNEIETELAQKLESYKMKYFMFNKKNQEVFYKPSFSGAKINAITSNTLKVMVPVSK